MLFCIQSGHQHHTESLSQPKYDLADSVWMDALEVCLNKMYAHAVTPTYHLVLDEAVKVLCGSILLCKVEVHLCPALLLYINDAEEDLGVGLQQRNEVERAIPMSSAAGGEIREGARSEHNWDKFLAFSML